MPEIGQTLSHFRIVDKIGQGGMGEVYLADDTTLDRKVALKFLPDAFTSDPERMARFEREAKLLASLNHPNIAGIFGLEQADGNRFLVLEYVEGETLQARLSKGALQLEDALELCRQIAEGLEAAHEKGVIHRDLKPANVMITAEEKVKILDFGLAKALSDETQSIDSSQSPTLTEAMTRPGVILGTAAYMSPEQAKGKEVDKRADIWAFGVVLFEMLTGRSLFSGEDVSSTLARVLERQPDFSALPRNLHPKITELLERCLEKEVRNRYGSISDARVDVQQVLADPGGVFVQPITADTPQKKLRTILPWVAAALISGLIIAGVAVWYLKPKEPSQVIRFDYDIKGDQKLTNLVNTVLAVSPDGSQFVYSTTDGLFLRSMNELDAKPLLSTNEDPSTPFFSPDGQWIGYFAATSGKLKKVAISGSAPPIDLCETTNFVGASWNSDDAIVFSEMERGILRVSSSGGKPEILIPSEGEAFYHPRLLPDAETILFTIGTSEGYKIAVQSLQSKERNILVPGDCASYLPTGHIVYALENNIYAIPFDITTLDVLGSPFLMVKGIYRNTPIYSPQYAISFSGTLAYMSDAMLTAPATRTLVWVDRDGKEEPLKAPARSYSTPRISPDGNRIALAINEDSYQNIYIYDLDREDLTLLTSGSFVDGSPLWTPDGQHIVFASNRGGFIDIYWVKSDGTGKIEKLSPATGGSNSWPVSWAEGHDSLAIQYVNKGFDIGVLSMEGERLWEPLLHEKYNEYHPQISPDGKWIVYGSDESGQPEIYIRSFPDVDKQRLQVSADGGGNPLWSLDGREIFYRNGGAIMTVQVKTDPNLSRGNPVLLFRGIYDFPKSLVSNSEQNVQWDIHPKTKHFLMMKPVGVADEEAAEEEPRKIIVVTNWFEELKERVPVP